MRIHTLIPVLLLLGTAPALAGDIYKWKEGGKTVYGEFPPSGITAELFKRETGRTVEASPKNVEVPDADSTPASGNTNVEANTVDIERYKQQRQQNCESAKRNLGLLQTGGRHRFKLPDGTVSYMDEEETKRRSEEAKQQINDFCA